MEQAEAILAALERDGFAAYIVGGAVRDWLLGVEPEDIDICTSAAPADIMAVADRQGWKTVTTGAAFGCVTVLINGQAYEVTTFRRDTYEGDGHRPRAVAFTVSLREDLARRDFTINAMARDLAGRIIDEFGGRADLARRLIRTVGDPQQRFAEDGLRMFRTARFAAKLGFSPTADIFPAIRANLDRVRGLAVERVTAELTKTLLAPQAGRGFEILRASGLLASQCRARTGHQERLVPVLPELLARPDLFRSRRYCRSSGWRHTLAVVDNIAATPVLRWAALLHEVGRGRPGGRRIKPAGRTAGPDPEPTGVESVQIILQRLRVDKPVTERVVWLLAHDGPLPAPDNKAALRWLRDRAAGFGGEGQFQEAVSQLLSIYEADRQAVRGQRPDDQLTELSDIISGLLVRLPFYPAQLAINGREIAARLGRGPQVAAFQQSMLARIQDGELGNDRPALLDVLAARARRLAGDRPAPRTGRRK